MSVLRLLRIGSQTVERDKKLPFLEVKAAICKIQTATTARFKR